MTFAGILSTLQLFAKQQTSFITNYLIKTLLNLDLVCPMANSEDFLGILGRTQPRRVRSENPWSVVGTEG